MTEQEIREKYHWELDHFPDFSNYTVSGELLADLSSCPAEARQLVNDVQLRKIKFICEVNSLLYSDDQEGHKKADEYAGRKQTKTEVVEPIVRQLLGDAISDFHYSFPEDSFFVITKVRIDNGELGRQLTERLDKYFEVHEVQEGYYIIDASIVPPKK